MAIKVTVGEPETQEERPFPKIVITDAGNIVEVFRHPEKEYIFFGIHRTGVKSGSIVLNFNPHSNCRDYNGPITLQNE